MQARSTGTATGARPRAGEQERDRITAVILAAGRGSRLGALTHARPKCLVRIGEYPILYHQLRALEACRFRRIIIVTGYRSAAIRRYVTRHFAHLAVRYVHNRRYRTTGDLFSFLLTRQHCPGAVLQINGDVLFGADTLRRLLAAERSAICLRRGRCGWEELKAIVQPAERRVLRLGKRLPPAMASGESMGIHFFSAPFATRLFRIAANLMRCGGDGETRATAIATALEQGERLSYVDVSRHPITEVDFPADIAVAKRAVLPRLA